VGVGVFGLYTTLHFENWVFLLLASFLGSVCVWGVVFLHTGYVGVMLVVCGVSVGACWRDYFLCCLVRA